MTIIEPNLNHVFFFPDRKGQRVCRDDVEISRWSRPKYKHISIEDFSVNLRFGGEDQQRLPARTKDNQRCAVTADFTFRVKSDDASLEISTRDIAASRRPKPVGSSFFQKALQTELMSLIYDCVRAVNYLDMLTSAAAINGLQESIKKIASAKAEAAGFHLVFCNTDIQLMDPSPESLTDDLKDQWLAHRRRAIALQNIDARVETERKLVDAQRESEEAKQQAALEIARATALEDRNKALGELSVAAQKREKEEKEKIALILAEKRKIDDAAQQEMARANNRLRLLEIELQRMEDKERYSAGLEIEQRKKEHCELELQRKELEDRIAEANAARLQVEGKAEAEVETLKKLAQEAAALEARRVLLKALPDILKAAYSPTEKLTDVKCLYITGAGETTALSGAGKDGFGSMLASMSSLPMLREVLHFVEEWNPKKSSNDSKVAS